MGALGPKLLRALENAVIGWAQWLALFLVVCAACAALERLRPAERGQPWSHRWFNVRWAALYGIVTRVLLIPCGVLVGRAIRWWGPGSIHLEFPATVAGQVAMSVAGLLALDFFYYWFHRLQHGWWVAWAIHKVHHSDVSVNATTMIDAWGYFNHLNVPLPLGPLTPLVSGPQLHRLHHSNEPGHVDCNFAAYFPVWDVVFRTYRRPAPGEWPRTGTFDHEELNGVARASAAPFRAWLGRA